MVEEIDYPELRNKERRKGRLITEQPTSGLLKEAEEFIGDGR